MKKRIKRKKALRKVRGAKLADTLSGPCGKTRRVSKQYPVAITCSFGGMKHGIKKVEAHHTTLCPVHQEQKNKIGRRIRMRQRRAKIKKGKVAVAA